MEGYYVPHRVAVRPRAVRLRRPTSAQDVGDEGTAKGKVNYTHMTLLAENTEGLHNLFRLSSLASLEGYYRKSRASTATCSSATARASSRTTGCPSGEVNRWLQVGQYDKALAGRGRLPRHPRARTTSSASSWTTASSIERRTRDDLLRLARTSSSRCWPPTTCTTRTPRTRSPTRCCCASQTGKTMADPNRFQFDARDFYLKSAARDARGLGRAARGLRQHPAGRRALQRRVHRGRATSCPRFPVPEGETEESWLVKEVERGLAHRFPNGVPDDRRDQAAYEVGVICQMGFPGYFLVTADLVAPRQGERASGSGPGRGSAAGALIAYALGITELDPMSHGLLFERFLNPERVSMPDIDMDFDERRRGDMIRYATREVRRGAGRADRHLRLRSRPRPRSRTPRACSATRSPWASSITKAMPPAVMGKDIPLAGHLRPEPRPLQARPRSSARSTRARPTLREVVDTARGPRGPASASRACTRPA